MAEAVGILMDASLSSEALRREVRERLPELVPGFRVLAEDLLGDGGRIEWVAADARGGVVLVLLGDAGECAEAMVRALAQAAWVAPRIQDWVKLAPGLDLQPDVPVRSVVVCPSFAALTIAAATALGPDRLQLIACRPQRPAANGNLAFEPVPATDAARPPLPGVGSAPTPTPFRSGLTEHDLNLSREERRQFESR
ncbi:MAG: hypothetical protein MJE66_11195 [Proteobacteria bacterium]|nr:hypothetical protein [Pseudomonadota bacterium]